jgi:alanyl-tRNA synthetase
VASALKVRPDEAAERVATLVEERRRFERELIEAKKKLALSGGGAGAANDGIREIGALRYLGRVVEGIAPRDLKGLVDEAKKSVGSGVVAFVGVSEDGKAALVVGVSDDLVGERSAVDLVRIGAEALGGKGGGGRPDMAQAGGPDGTKAGAALEAIEAALTA